MDEHPPRRYRPWVREGQGLRLVSAEVFILEQVIEFTRDLINVIVLPADVVPDGADAASRQCVRQQMTP